MRKPTPTPSAEPTTEAGRALLAADGFCDIGNYSDGSLDVDALRAAIVEVERQARADAAEQVARLRQQNHEAAERHDREVAELRSRVARYENDISRAKELVRGSPVDWTNDPPSQEPDGWWRYTSQNNRTVLLAAVHELAADAAVPESVPAAPQGWTTLTLADVLPNWGEGTNEAEARDDLLSNVIERHRGLEEDRSRLAPGLLTEVVFMNRLLNALRPAASPAADGLDAAPNRWAAFTTEELHELDNDLNAGALESELWRELQSRFPAARLASPGSAATPRKGPDPTAGGQFDAARHSADLASGEHGLDKCDRLGWLPACPMRERYRAAATPRSWRGCEH